jgi:hypothetical protein
MNTAELRDAAGLPHWRRRAHAHTGVVTNHTRCITPRKVGLEEEGGQEGKMIG